ncbi:hypothetical protein KM043_005733 [Ampulex compressa]|nr:hypothetical protein KM043_005733 [Ampulex compressa]
MARSAREAGGFKAPYDRFTSNFGESPERGSRQFSKTARGSVTAVGPRCFESGRCNSGQTSLNTIPSAPSYFQDVLWPPLLSETKKGRGRTVGLEATKISVPSAPLKKKPIPCNRTRIKSIPMPEFVKRAFKMLSDEFTQIE